MQIDYTDPFAAQQAQAQASLQAAQQAKQYRAPQAPGMVGRVYVGAHPLQGLAEVLRNYQAGNQEEAAIKQLQDIGKQRQEATNRDMGAFVQALRGTPAFEAAGPAPQGAPQEGGYPVPAQKGDLMKAYSGLMQSGNPILAQAGMKGVVEMPQIQMQEAAKAAQLARQEAADRERERHNRATEERMMGMIGAQNSARAEKQNLGKTLPSGEVDKITGLDESLGTQQRLMQTFKPEYGGYKSDIVGGLANTVGAKFSDKLQPQAEWWAAHEANDNIMRNKLFGASLTAGEQAAWDRTSIKPGMTPSMIENRMAERAALINAQRNTRLGNLEKAGYNVKDFGQAPDTFKPTSPAVGIPSADAIAAELARRGGK